MKIFKQVLAVLVIVLSALLLVLSLTGIIGVWVVNKPVTDTVLGLFEPIEGLLQLADSVVDRVNTRVAEGRQALTDIQGAVETLGSDVEENRPILTEISTRVGERLGPTIDAISEIVETTRQTVTAIQEAVEAINSIPFVSVPTPDMTALEQVRQDVSDLVTAVEELRAGLEQKRTDLIQGVVSALTEPLARIDQRLQGMQTPLNQLDARLQETLDKIAWLKGRIPVWIDIASVAVTLLLAWIAFSQVGLIAHAWSFFSKAKMSTGNEEVYR